jgi:site-specific recombinase XerD
MASRRSTASRASAAGFERLRGDWLDGLGSANTRDAYERDLEGFRVWCTEEGHAPLHATTGHVESYRDACNDRGAGRATISRRLSALSSFYDHAVEAEAVADNPVRAAARPTPSRSPRPASLTDSESTALYDAALELGPREAALVGLLLWDGLKLGEALALDLDEIDVRGSTLWISVRRRGRTDNLRLDPRSARAIRRYVAGRNRGPLFVGQSPTRAADLRLTRFGGDYLVKQAARDAGLEGRVSANTLRRSYMAAAHRRGSTTERIRAQVGHRSERDTRRFL